MTEIPAHPAYERLRQVLPHAAMLLANNPGAYELDGTNTWLLRDDPSRREAIVIDPGPEDWDHSRRIVEEAGRVVSIVITHRHGDHTEGVKKLVELTGAPVFALDPAHRLGTEGLVEGSMISGAGVAVSVMLTPGHSSDSTSLVLGEPGAPEAVLTGDMVLGRGTTVIGYPDGELETYLESMERLRGLGALPVLPGHGPELTSIQDIAAYYLTHRRERLDQVRQARARLGLDKTARQIVEVVYTDVPESVKGAATSSTKAQLAYLDIQDGRVPQSGRLAYASEEEVAKEEAERAAAKAKSDARMAEKRAQWAANEAAAAQQPSH
ncbi:MAG: MBL fold metallo-hydrolase [Frankiaceae bacterium]|jgi:glyoxylase-like metal-dependent hydrolase (beta-lactamase superfamily II)|nr:MBL fold metallo-hydrolase [Frankiaceae bacterium]